MLIDLILSPLPTLHFTLLEMPKLNLFRWLQQDSNPQPLKS